MKFLKDYYTLTVKHDLINKFNNKTIKTTPKLESIILNFGCKSSDFKILATCSLALELITGQKSTLTRAKKSSIILKIRKGSPVGCKITLKNETMYLFLDKLITEIFPKMRLNKVIPLKNSFINTKVASYTINNILIFTELEKNYYLFNIIANLQINFLTNTKTKNELVYLLNCYKLPFSTICKCNSIGRV